MRRPLRLLVVSPFPPRHDASHGGSRAIAQLVRQLAARHRVALVFLREADERDADALLYEQCERVVQVGTSPRDNSLGARLVHRLRVRTALLRGLPTWVVERTAPDFSRTLSELAAEWKPDVVQLEFQIMGQFLPALANCEAPRVLREHEPLPSAVEEARRLHRGLAGLRLRLEAAAWRRFERAVIAQVQAVAVFTERDRVELAPFAGTTPIVTIPLKYDVPMIDARK